MKFNSLKKSYGVELKFIKYWLAVVLWMGLIFWMSTGTFSLEHTSRFIVPVLHFLFPWLSPQEIELIHKLVRQAAHVTEYFILGLFLFRAFRGDSLQAWRPRWTIYAVICVLLYAVGDEFHQLFVPTRTASFIDVGIDSAGGVLSQVAVMILCHPWLQQHKRSGRCERGLFHS